MRNMSFALTTEQIRKRTKTVTRRLGWTFLRPGDLICAVEKNQGLKKGEKVRRLAVLRVTSVRREKLRVIMDDTNYGMAETLAEGFADFPLRDPRKFAAWFAATHKCEIGDLVTRIAFEYCEDAA